MNSKDSALRFSNKVLSKVVEVFLLQSFECDIILKQDAEDHKLSDDDRKLITDTGVLFKKAAEDFCRATCFEGKFEQTWAAEQESALLSILLHECARAEQASRARDGGTL